MIYINIGILIFNFVAFYSKSYDNFYIPDHVDDFNKSNDSEGLSKDFNKLQINSKDEVVQNVYKMDVTQQQVNKHYTDDDDVTIQIFVQKNKMELKFPMALLRIRLCH
ncbi:unnamed protein product [Rhizophagus irregularis]|nr:unnamed protein product [Rhizophagus irregularis]